MPTPDTDNQHFFATNKAREQACAAWLKAQSKAAKKPILIAAGAGILNGLGVIAQAALLSFILQALIIEHASWQVLVKPGLLLLTVFIVRSLCVYWQQTVGFEASAEIKSKLRQALSTKFAALGPAYSKHQQSGELATIPLEQVEALEAYFSRYLPQQFIVSILPLVMIAVVMPINWVVGVIFLLTGPLVPVFMALVGMGAASAQRNQFLAMARMGGYFQDRLQGLSTLKLFGQAWQELDNINRIADDFREKTMAVLRIAFLSSAVLEFFSAVAVALVAVYVGLGLLGAIQFGPAQHITLSEALFVLLLAPEFFMPLRQLAIYYHDKAAAIAAADAILGILEQNEVLVSRVGNAFLPTKSVQDKAREQNCITSMPFRAPPSIEFDQVDKIYGQRQVLTAIDLTINAGEKIALTGESGAGKTTLINLLLGFEAPTHGRVLLAGHQITQEWAAQHIAWVGQNAGVFHGTLRDNIAIASPGASEQAIVNAAMASGVAEFSEQLPEGLLTAVGERGYGLSGGQIQRLALARAFLKNTDIIILDEPTANLDTGSKTLLLDTIDRLFKNKTLLIASHDAAVIERLSRQIVLQQGRLVS
ncbi:MAG: thiol reductant ABC exporter subunit CydD [Methylococcaceae bacterium]|nr:thiol reductant ABC exporter subunit CydD [Methylococcaceae bacterium]MDP2395302.1 thiol reductant ABC exporter subunit CydD [Methylococcaceae bacterium]MDP3020586.1 thiol reductant ABC exporter subunit CydD [Methylococcaceae bacterium]MDP3390025.1 thiol reductant ABC exporter subunit CydD [Methylococcaceae bacterium]MDZ4155579.1 thiol reductant ABC exporter subunit CydD [Methylococcales bacterium]